MILERFRRDIDAFSEETGRPDPRIGDGGPAFPRRDNPPAPGRALRGPAPFAAAGTARKRRRPFEVTTPRVLRFRVPTPPPPANRFDTTAKGRARAKRHRLWIREAGCLVRAQRIGRLSGPVTLDIAVKRLEGADISTRITAVADLLVRMGVIDGDGCVQAVSACWSDATSGATVTVTRAP